MSGEATDVETCRLAMTVAQEEGLKECSSTEGKKRVVADELGLDSFPGPDSLDDTPTTIRESREYVFALLFHGDDPLLEDHDNDLYSALQAAWKEVDALESDESGEADEGEEDEDTDEHPDEDDDPGEEADEGELDDIGDE